MMSPQLPGPDHDDELQEEEEDLSVLDTLEFAGVLESGEFDAVIAPRPRPPLHDRDRAAAPDSVAGGETNADEQVTAVELLGDTQLEMCPLEAADQLGPRVDAMPLYEQLRLCCSTRFDAVAVQMTMRSGRVVISSIADPDRRRRVAEFSSQAIGSVAHLELDGQFGVLHAGDLHVFVISVDEVRVFTALFSQPPALDKLVSALQPLLHDFRLCRGQS